MRRPATAESTEVACAGCDIRAVRKQPVEEVCLRWSRLCGGPHRRDHLTLLLPVGDLLSLDAELHVVLARVVLVLLVPSQDVQDPRFGAVVSQELLQ